jgi:hypothetical protein
MWAFYYRLVLRNAQELCPLGTIHVTRLSPVKKTLLVVDFCVHCSLEKKRKLMWDLRVCPSKCLVTNLERSLIRFCYGKCPVSASILLEVLNKKIYILLNFY